jgi:hypothetical protein
MATKMNKRASGFGDVYTIFIFLFVVVIVGGISVFFITAFNTAWQSTDLGAIGDESQVETQSYVDLTINVLDGAFILWFAILWIGALVTAFFLDNSPVFYILFFLGGIMSLFSLVPLAGFIGALEGTQLGSAFALLPMTTFIMRNSLLFILAFLISNGLALYAKFRVQG